MWRFENQMTSPVSFRTRQFTVPEPDSKKFCSVSSSTSRTSPVSRSATRSCARLWSRELERKASCDPSALHSTSRKTPPGPATWSVIDERCGSGGICTRTTRGPSRWITTRLMRKIRLSPGSGYFQDASSGRPTSVVVMCIIPTPRPSCWKVAIMSDPGDQSSTGESRRTHPALLVA